MGEAVAAPHLPLCVLTPEFGISSETFIRWDIEELLPARTVAIADPPPAGESLRRPVWSPSVPNLCFTPQVGDPPPSADRQDQLARFLAENGVQVVLVEFLDFADRWFDLLSRLPVRVWLRGHGVDVSARLTEERFAEAYQRYRRADGIIVPSRSAADRLAGVGLPAALIHVVANHVAVPDTPPLPRTTSTIRCVMVGRLVPKKGPGHSLAAFHRALMADPRLVLDIVGDGPLEGELRRYVARHGLTARVLFHGAVPHPSVLEVIRSSHILLHHAITGPDGDREGQPLAVLEALAAGTVVVATAHEGIADAITHGRNGLLAAEGDTGAMTASILHLARHPDELARLAEAGWRSARAAHQHEHVRTQLLRLLDLGEETGS